jgi:NAD(P)-dependent dehydrogenase (short-subunit alcohol dehydrogenase family)
MHPKRIVVLGGCGQAGRSVVRLLQERTDASMILADRRNLEASLRDLQTGAGSDQRITARYADAENPSSLAEVFRGADLVVVTATTAKFTANVVKACLESHCDYFDILDSPEVADAVNQFAPQAEAAGLLFVTQGGIAPGMIAPMVRHAHASLDRLRGARLGHAMSLKIAQRVEQIYDVFDFIVKTRPAAFEGGAWREKTFGDMATIDFGPRFGTRQAFAITMPEVLALPGKLGLEELSMYAASPNAAVDYVVKKLIMGLHKIRPRLGWPTLAKLLFWGSRKMVNEPTGFVNVLEAWGERNGQKRRLRLVVEDEDNYRATAAAVFSFLRQYFSGAFKEIKGVRMMGHLIDPEAALKDLKELGVTVQEQPDV